MTHTKILTLALISLCLPPSIGVAQPNQQEQSQSIPYFQFGVIVDGDLLAVDRAGHLLRLNATWGGKHDYGTFNKALGPHIDAANGKAYVTTADEVCEVDLSSGKIVRAAGHRVGQCRVGVIDEQRVFVQNGAKIEILDLDAGSTLHTIELCDDSRHRLFNSTMFPHVMRGNRLYVALSTGREIAEIDVNRGQVVRRIETNSQFVTGLHVAGQQLYACQFSCSYGVVHESMAIINLETLQRTAFEVPESRDQPRELKFIDDETYVRMAMVSQPDGGFSIAVGHGIYQFDEKGQAVAKADPLQSGQLLIAATTYGVIVSTAEGCVANALVDIETAAK